MKLEDKLQLARVNAGKLLDLKWRQSGLLKPLTQDDAAREIGLSKRTYCGLEAGEFKILNKFTMKRILAFCVKYNTQKKPKENE